MRPHPAPSVLRQRNTAVTGLFILNTTLIKLETPPNTKCNRDQRTVMHVSINPALQATHYLTNVYYSESERREEAKKRLEKRLEKRETWLMHPFLTLPVSLSAIFFNLNSPATAAPLCCNTLLDEHASQQWPWTWNHLQQQRRQGSGPSSQTA